MGTIREAAPAKLFMAVMHRPDFDPAPLIARLADRYGAVDFRCAPYSFESSYYRAEMGPGLLKFFVSFEPLLPQERLSGVKGETNVLEQGGADARGRVCNLDPGIITHYSVILATTKGYAHRVYLGEGIYAEPTLLFRRGSLDSLPWSYPDYQTPAACDFFRAARRRLLEQAGATNIKVVTPEGWPENSPMWSSTLNSYRVLRLCHEKLTPRYRQLVAEQATHKRVHHLRSASAMKAFVGAVTNEYSGIR